MSEKKLQSFDDIFGKIEKSKEPIEALNSSVEIEIDAMIPFKNHPFKIYEGQRLEDMVLSIKEMGVILPVIVRGTSDNHYEILSGHNRVNAAKLAGLNTVPAVIKSNLTNEEAMLIVTETNLMQRSFSDLLPSERAKALKSHHDALSQQGARTDLINEIKMLLNADEISVSETSSQVAKKLTSLDKVGQNYELSKDTVARYIRLNYLIDEIIDRVDKGEIAFIPAVSLSYLKENEQDILNQLIISEGYRVDIKKADLMKQYSLQGKLNSKKIEDILSGSINQLKQQKSKPFNIRPHIITRFFKEDVKAKDIEQVIEKALEEYFKEKSE